MQQHRDAHVGGLYARLGPDTYHCALCSAAGIRRATHSMRTRKLTLAGSVAAASLFLAACGGSSHKSTTTGKTSTTTSAPTTTTTKKKTSTVRPLKELVIVEKSGAPAGPSVSAKAGDRVVFRTTVPGVVTGKPVKVLLALASGPGKKLTVTASAAGQRSTASVTSSGGTPITLFEPHYGCPLPPVPTFCPAHGAALVKGTVTAQFKAPPAIPIEMTAVVGPVPGVAPFPTPGTVVVPAYVVTEGVAARSPTTPTTATPAPPTTTAAAKPGDTVVLQTKLKGSKNGTPQPVTVSFNQGPAKTLTVSASVPGGAVSRATITSATGSPIALVTPRYSCFLPPKPTFCPLSKVKAAGHHYSITFPGAPYAAVTIEALAQAG